MLSYVQLAAVCVVIATPSGRVNCQTSQGGSGLVPPRDDGRACELCMTQAQCLSRLAKRCHRNAMEFECERKSARQRCSAMRRYTMATVARAAVHLFHVQARQMQFETLLLR
ncbi:uncharacterized protein L969DRAFT_51966 [Mixia osmundae IAM 14324]|uniref:Extracellular membrane protein CFEM domain-containing protein n=1 Tax=Mixia osmundae (strain CBS 9802 / IAM 14324 / JCM 22182 / KY 12970) TaxID=764103 RepID=G7DX30_MIXOS|nr:uncharacterized protein L969DRAFT_51966 [Mixia osmundae IAM 14324]KEI38065.1 hypothetical protein L969DRAFT_51966 [Mixia osmundae IAM 14324]GAA95127.1 hypothetical protein E5Q_01782 [Mixia osmundae IAM 14324]